MRASVISRVKVAHGVVSGTEDGAKLPPRCFVKGNYRAEQYFFSYIMSGDKRSLARRGRSLFSPFRIFRSLFA